MAALKLTIVVLACMLAVAFAAPSPGFFGKKHEHVVIHVPYNVHTVHHHHVEKVGIPIVKHVPIVKEVHVPIVKHVPVPYHVEPIHHGWSAPSGSGWW